MSEKFLFAIFVYSQDFCQKVEKGKLLGLKSSRLTHYLLDHDDFNDCTTFNELSKCSGEMEFCSCNTSVVEVAVVNWVECWFIRSKARVRATDQTSKQNLIQKVFFR